MAPSILNITGEHYDFLTKVADYQVACNFLKEHTRYQPCDLCKERDQKCRIAWCEVTSPNGDKNYYCDHCGLQLTEEWEHNGDTILDPDETHYDHIIKWDGDPDHTFIKQK